MICKAKSKSTGKSCGNLALAGQEVCRFHGGAAPQAKRKAVERQVEAEARTELGKLSALLGPAEPVEDPLGELLQLAGEAKRWKELLEGRVSQLASVGYEGVMGEQVKAEVALLERAMDRLAAVLATIGKLRIDERLIKINSQVQEVQAEAIFAAVNAVLDWLGLTQLHRQQARQIIAGHLRVSRQVSASGSIEEIDAEIEALKAQLAPLPPRPALYRVVEREVVREVEVERPCPNCTPAPEPIVIEQPPEKPAALPPAPERRRIEPYRPMGEPLGLSQALGGPWPQAWS